MILISQILDHIGVQLASKTLHGAVRSYEDSMLAGKLLVCFLCEIGMLKHLEMRGGLFAKLGDFFIHSHWISFILILAEFLRTEVLRS